MANWGTPPSAPSPPLRLPARDGSSELPLLCPKEFEPSSSEDYANWELPASSIPLNSCPLFRADSRVPTSWRLWLPEGRTLSLSFHCCSPLSSRTTGWVQIPRRRAFLGHPHPQLYLPLLLNLFLLLPHKREKLVLPVLLGAFTVQGAKALQGLSMLFCWGGGGDCTRSALGREKGCQGHGHGACPSLPPHTACTTFLPSFYYFDMCLLLAFQ